ncbi:response regulator transcription factor [Spiribacter halobius]|uniref:response regulator transcription factor n=1 Tax=Sediminicurvatus halobius TaxID=2182432 RepID=UPI00268E647A|nr:response regulator [Spiribacter halobius]
MSEQIWLVDDEEDIREAVGFLLGTAGYSVRTFAGPSELLAEVTPAHRGCLLLDVRLPEMDGLELQTRLREAGVNMPILFISGHGDIPMAVRAVNAGALDFLEKPFDDETLLERVARALELDREQAEHVAAIGDIERRLGNLTPREREVMEHMLEGKLNKIIAADLGMSVRTVEVHRARVLEKLGVRNSSEMVRKVLSTETYRDWLV